MWGVRVVVPYVDALRAEILLREGKAEEGRALMKDVQARLRALPGPDAWTQALFRLDAFARIARDVGDWDLAEYTALQMIDHDAAYGGSHLALALVARHRGDVEVAQQEAAAARKYWKDADRDLKELAQLRDGSLRASRHVDALQDPVIGSGLKSQVAQLSRGRIVEPAQGGSGRLRVPRDAQFHGGRDARQGFHGARRGRFVQQTQRVFPQAAPVR